MHFSCPFSLLWCTVISVFKIRISVLLVTVCFPAGILDEVLNRLRFDSPIGATVERKPATHFVNEDMKVLSDTRVRKGAVLQCIISYSLVTNLEHMG